MFCFHKWNEVKDNRQTCKKCGIVRNVECSHKYEIISQRELLDFSGQWDSVGRVIGFTYTLQCVHCGILKKTEFRLGD